MSITKEHLKNAYLDYVNELVRKISSEIHQKAKHGPSFKKYTTRIKNVDEIVIDTLIERLSKLYIDSKITLKSEVILLFNFDDENDLSCHEHTITIDWS